MKIAARVHLSSPAESIPQFQLNVLFLLLISLLCISAQQVLADGPSSRSGAFIYTGGNGYSGSAAPVSGYGINTSSGTLSLVSGSPFSLPGRLLAVVGDPTGKFVYVATDDGSLSAFTVDSQAGSLTPVAGGSYTAPTGGSSYWASGKLLAIDPTGKHLYVAGGSNLYGLSIDRGSGALAALTGSPFALSASALAVDPWGQYLAVYNGSGVQSYAINSSTGALTAAGTMVSGCGGSHMTFEPSGHFLYGTTGAGITACRFDSSSGALAVVTGSPFATSSGASFMGVAAHPSGSFLYATDSTCVDYGPQNRLYGFVIDPSTGALTAIGGSPFALPSGGGCNYDFDVAAEASGNFVFTVDANDGIAAYKVTASTGALRLASSSFSGPAAYTLATVANAMSATATVTGLEITPATAQITTSSLGKQYQFTLKATYSDGSTGFLTRSASWTSSDPTVATVAAGLATSTGYGSTAITASIDGQSANATLTVNPLPPTIITITPQNITLHQGTELQLKAAGQYRSD
jgi:6-phosphogluconolactonase (cycloisomerase 2 family)